MSNEEKLIIKLLNEFSFYNKSVVYYQNIIKNIDFVNVNDLLNKLRKKIVNNMTNDWSMGNIDWFCSAIMRADDLLEAFSKLFERLEKYGLGPDEKFVKTIIIKYPDLKERILQEFGFSDNFNISDDIEDPLMRDFLTCFYLFVDGDLDLEGIDKYQNNTNYFKELEAIRNELKNVSGKEKDKLVKQKKLILEKIIEANMPLVKSIARKYLGNMEFDDLVQEGCLGILKAIEMYDAKRKYQFSTYATWWIRQAITRAIGNKSKIIRVPVHSYPLMFKISQSEKDLTNELDRVPTDEEIAEKLKISPNQVKLLRNVKNPISLNFKIGDDKDTELGDLIENPAAPLPEEIVENNIDREKVYDLLMVLDARSRNIIMLRFGFFSDRNYTLQEIAEMYGNITRERIRQIEKRSLNKLHHLRNREVTVPFSLKTFLVNGDEVIKKANLLLPEDYQFLQKAFGKYLNRECYDSNKYFGVERIIKNLSVYKDKKEGEKKMARRRAPLLKDILKISDIELEEFSLTFDTKYKFYNILFKVYGDNLEDEAKVMADEKGYFSQVIFKLRQIYASFSKLTEKRINDYLGYNDKKRNKLLKNLDKESEIYQASLPIVGENLDKVIDYKILTEEQRNILRIFINYLRSININKKEIKKTNTVEIINDEEYSKFLTPFKHPFFKEFVKLLPIEYRFITMLRLGLYDDKIYSLKELSVIFNIGENEVLLRTEKGILLFKNFIQEYERIYGQNFPELEGESGTMLKLLPQK